MTRIPLLLLVLGASACGTVGAFGQATMFRECSPGDANCRRATPAAPIAVGARLRPDVRIDVRGSVMPVVALSSSREDIVAVEDGALVAKKPGMSAVLIASADGTIIDFQHLWVAEATGIVVERPSPVGNGVEEVVGPLQLVSGEQVILTSTMIAGAQRLAGESELAWEVENPAAITLLRDGSTGRRRLVARQPGIARVTVAALGITTTFDVEVVP